MHTAIVKLDSLTDAVGPAPQDDDSIFSRLANFAFVFIGRVKIRCLGSELGTTRVDRFIGRQHAGTFACRTNDALVSRPQPRQLSIAEPESLGATPTLAIKGLWRGSCQHAALFVNGFHLIQKPHIDTCCRVHDVEIHPTTNTFTNLKNAVGCSSLDSSQQLRVVVGRKVLFGRVTVEAGTTDF